MTIRRVDERYTLLQEIGRGGSGPVWLGEDEVLGRRVAIKRIGLPPGTADVDAVRAEREARLAARVNHPHVVAVYDLVESEEDHWLVMEYVEGTTLSGRVRAEGPLGADETARILAPVADALAAAHAAGIVHRDVKPSNILLGTDGSVKLSDFGIARALADASLTQTGLVTGSPAYLSPEVASGGSAHPASDVWSFGATLYHCLAGRPPYDVGENLMGAMYRIVHEDPPRLATAGWLAPLLEATMTKDPQARPAMSDVVAYFEALPPEQPGPATAVLPVVPPAPSAPTGPTAALPVDTPPPPPPTAPAAPAAPGEPRRGRRRIAPALAGVAALLVVAVVGAALLLGGSDDQDPTGAEPATATDSPTSADPTTASTSPTTAPPPAPTAAELEDFARSYVTTAASDPEAGFALLTPSYQRASPRYEEFWGSVSEPRIQEISADPDAMQVTYTYSYEVEGEGRRTETVTLDLVQEGEDLLIAGDASG